MTADIASSRAEVMRRAIGRIRENSAYAQLQERVREIGELKGQLQQPGRVVDARTKALPAVSLAGLSTAIGMCPLAATKNCPEAARSVTECDC